MEHGCTNDLLLQVFEYILGIVQKEDCANVLVISRYVHFRFFFVDSHEWIESNQLNMVVMDDIKARHYFLTKISTQIEVTRFVQF